MRRLAFILALASTAAGAWAVVRPLPFVLSAPSTVQIEAASVWDFGEWGVLADGASNYARSEGPMLYECINDSCAAFFCQGDSMLWAGANVGRHTRFLLDERVPVGGSGVFSFDVGFAGSGLDADHRPFSLRGWVKSDFINSGTICFRGDSLKADLHRHVVEVVAGDEVDEFRAVETIYRWVEPGSVMPLAVLKSSDRRLYCCDFGLIERVDDEADFAPENLLGLIGYSLSQGRLVLAIPACGFDADIDVNVVDVDGFSTAMPPIHICANEASVAAIDLSSVRVGRTLVVLKMRHPGVYERKIAVTL